MRELHNNLLPFDSLPFLGPFYSAAHERFIIFTKISRRREIVPIGVIQKWPTFNKMEHFCIFVKFTKLFHRTLPGPWITYPITHLTFARPEIV